MRTFTLFLALVATFSLGGLSSPEPATAQETDIVGNWVLNRDKSDDPREVMARSRRRPPREDPAAGGEQRRRRGGRDGGQGQTRRRPGEGDRLLQRRLMSPALNLTITRTDSTYVFSSEGQQFGEHFFDGRKLKSTVGTELDIEIKAEWKKNRLEIETKTSGGAKLKERYELDEDTGELRVELDYSNTRLDQRIKIKQVYDRRGDG